MHQRRVLPWVIVGPFLFLAAGCLEAPLGDGGAGQGGAGADAGTDVPGWTLILDDEFDGSGPGVDSGQTWSTYDGPVDDAPDTSFYSSDQLWRENGHLRLALDNSTVGQGGYVCGGLETAQSLALSEGRWEVRGRFPSGKGTAGYLTIQAPSTSAVDFGGVIGTQPLDNQFSVYDAANDNSDDHVLSGSDWTAGFHVYTVIVQQGTVIWQVDGTERYRTSAVTSEPMLLNLTDYALPCNDPAGCPDASTVLPAFLDIDYVRIYRPATSG